MKKLVIGMYDTSPQRRISTLQPVAITLKLSKNKNHEFKRYQLSTDLKPEDLVHTFVNIGPTESQGDLVHIDRES